MINQRRTSEGDAWLKLDVVNTVSWILQAKNVDKKTVYIEFTERLLR